MFLFLGIILHLKTLDFYSLIIFRKEIKSPKVMKFNFLKISSMALLAILLVASCKDDEPVVVEKPLFEKEGFFATNEGPFGGNGSLYFYEKETGTVHANAFAEANNGAVIGQFVQSAAFIGDNAYLVANGSNKIEVVNHSDLKSVGTITGVTQPRYLVEGAGNVAYVSQWGNGFSGQVKVVNTDDLTVTDSIVIGGGPEGMLVDNAKLYVTNSGGYGADSTLFILNTGDNSIAKEVEVGGCPTRIVKSADGTIWVMAAGCYDASFAQQNGHITKLEGDNATHIYAHTDPLDNMVESPDGADLFVTSFGGVFRFNKANGAFDSEPVIVGGFYSLGVDKKANKLYVGMHNGGEPGTIYVYDLGAGNMPAIVDSLDAGVYPGEFYFQD